MIRQGDDRADTEATFINIVKACDSSNAANLTVSFGKNGAGKTTAAIKNSAKLIVDLSLEDIQAIIDKVNNIE